MAVAVEALGGQRETARLLNLSQPAIHNWIKGKSDPPREKVYQIAEKLRVHPQDIEFGDLAQALAARQQRVLSLSELDRTIPNTPRWMWVVNNQKTVSPAAYFFPETGGWGWMVYALEGAADPAAEGSAPTEEEAHQAARAALEPLL
jgi:DNA-binding transcriptional regulator YdaS (Cro superfamily)